jgi:hypothetical protein
MEEASPQGHPILSPSRGRPHGEKHPDFSSQHKFLVIKKNTLHVLILLPFCFCFILRKHGALEMQRLKGKEGALKDIS